MPMIPIYGTGFRPHHTTMRHGLYAVAWSVMTPAKAAELVEMPFGIWTVEGLRNKPYIR